MTKKENYDLALKLIAGQIRGLTSTYTVLIESLKEVFVDESLKENVLSNICRETITSQEVVQLIVETMIAMSGSANAKDDLFEEIVNTTIDDIFFPLRSVMIRFMEEKKVNLILDVMIVEIHEMLAKVLCPNDTNAKSANVN